MSQFLARKINRSYDELIYNVVSWIISGFEAKYSLSDPKTNYQKIS